MRYIGSKTASVQAIERAVAASSLKDLTHFCDPFAGICTVSLHFKGLGYRITTGDILAQSYTFQVATIVANQIPRFTRLITALDLQPNNGLAGHLSVLSHLNGLPNREDFVSWHYSTLGSERRKFFTRSNARRIDAIRHTIAEWKQQDLLNTKEEAYLLATLLHAMDRVANTAGTYYAYLKYFYRKARRALELLPFSIQSNKEVNKAHIREARDLTSRLAPDILYLDPPYNERDYGAYYHLTESVILWNKPLPHGRSGIPMVRSPKSVFCSVATAESAMYGLIKGAKARLILLHYAIDGLVKHNNILEMLSEKGATTFRTWNIRKYSTRAGSSEYCGNRLYACRPRE